MLKKNIDLTSDEFFSSRVGGYRNLFRLTRFSRFPWEVFGDRIFSELDASEDEIVLTGSKRAIQIKSKTSKEESRKYCDCCGAYIAAIPWEFNVGLCRKCDKELEKEYSSRHGVFPWNQEN